MIVGWFAFSAACLLASWWVSRRRMNLAGAREYFNDTVTILRDHTSTFPGILLAGRARAGTFGSRELIVAGQEEKAQPTVSLG